MSSRAAPRPTPEEPAFMSRQVKAAERFYLGLGAPLTDELTVLCGGWELTAPDYLIRRDTYPWFAVEFVAGGKGWLEIAGARHELRRGCFFTYGPDVPLRIESDRKHLLSKFFVNFGGGQATNLLAATRLHPGRFRVLPNADEIEAALRLLVYDGRHHRPHTPAIVALQLRIVLLKLAEQPHAAGDSDRGARQTLRRCREYMDQHFVSTTTAEQVARACHLSPSHLSRLFQRFGHGSPYEYLIRQRMVHAAELLDAGDLLVREVAEKLGMDPFQFSRVFKRVHGLSPAQFARRHGR